MAKDHNPSIANIMNGPRLADLDLGPNSLNGDTPSVMIGFASGFDPEAVITQMLENNVGVLDNLRQVVVAAGQRSSQNDVRLHGHPASDLLTGFEAPLDYHHLVAVINTMKAGIARRRVAAA